MQKWLQKQCNIYYIKCNELQRIALNCAKLEEATKGTIRGNKRKGGGSS